MNIKKLLSLAVIAALPLSANAENISGAMYAAPTRADTNHPAPTTNTYAPYGRIDIDTADQEHIATTAYVKGAYNSAIAAVNKVGDAVDFLVANFETRQARLGLYDPEEDDVGTDISPAILESLSDVTSSSQLVNGMAVKNAIDAQRVEVYTNWDDDTDKTEVAFVVASAQE